MNCIELMVEEHKNIKRMLAVIRKYCSKILNGENIRYEDFYKIIDFVRNYADKHHHGKEESMLFNRMVDELGSAGEKLVKFGMNVEHDMGRFYIQELETAIKRVIDGEADARLDVIANAISYSHLLHRHIDKEDNIVYKFAENNLKKDTLETINQESEVFEKKATENNTQNKYLELLNQLERQI